MLQNVLITALTPLCNTDEISSWENRPFASIWPEPQQQEPKAEETPKIVKKKPKRVRTAYTTEQIRVLEKTYARNRYIDSISRKELASRLSIGEKCIKIWFQNRRMKEKRDSDTSCDSSSESFTNVSSPVVITQPNEEVDKKKVETEYTPTFYHYTESEPSYQMPTFQYQGYTPYNTIPNRMQPNPTFYYDTNVYPTQYYPAECYSGHQYGNFEGENNWSSTVFDMGYY